MKKVKYLLSFVLVLILMSSCEPIAPTSSEKQGAMQETALQEAVREVGMPAITNWLEMKTLKTVYEKRDNNKLINYAYAFSEVTGKFIFMGKCIGFPIPYATQFTAPERPAKRTETFEEGNLLVPQADPNGLYSPASADGTWLLLINPETGEPQPIYMEPKVTVTPFPLNENICVGGINK